MDVQELDALLDSAKLPEATVELCLRGDLQAEWEKLEAQLIERRRANATLADSVMSELATRQRELGETMRRATLTLRLRAMDRPNWADLRASYPPRENDRTDHVLGVNQDAFFPALIRRSVVEPELTDDQFDKLISKISDAQFDKLADTAWNLNRRDVSVPFSPTASPVASSSDETSKQPSG